jgi:leucyl aminopeptidase
MDIVVRQGDPFALTAPLLVVGAYEDEALPAPLADLLEAADWRGRPKQTALLYPRGAVPSARVLLIGLGKRDALNAERLRVAAAVAVQQARELRIAAPTFAVPTISANDVTTIDAEAAGQALAEGALLGNYRFTAFKSDLSDDERFVVDEVAIVVADEALAAGLTTGVSVGSAVARGVQLARDLANSPGNSLTPTALADAAASMAGETGLQATVWGREQLAAEGFGGLLAVAKGSAEEPRFVVLEHGQAGQGPTICLVGKGITFDTGGISIKPAANMEDMKFDMGGAAAVIGALRAVADLKLPLHVVGLVAACENMPSATAYKPGDIITTLSGKTIEVLNTDAEGRIILADALYYAQRYNPAAIIDLATLTGACVVALGHAAAGLIGNDEALVQRIAQAGEQTGERAWHLPLYDDYKEQIKSTYADIKNTGGREGGALTAAAFLSHFAGQYPWAHLDIAGTAWTTQPKPYQPKGATGYGVRLLVAALRAWNDEA